MNGFEPLEEWLASQEQRLQGSLSKAWQSLLAIIAPILLSFASTSVLLKITGAALWVSLLLNFRLVSWACALRVEARKRHAGDAKPQKADACLSELEFSLLSLIYDRYPERFTRDELEKHSGAPRVELDHALASMMRMTPKLILSPSGGLWRQGQPNPAGLRITIDGMDFVKKRRNTQAQAGNQMAAGVS